MASGAVVKDSAGRMPCVADSTGIGSYVPKPENLCTFEIMEAKAKPEFDPRLFWDVDFESIDYDKYFRYVIERVFERGDVQDIRNCRRYYGDDKVREVLLNAKFLPEITMYLAAAVVDRPVTDFRCYKLRQLNPTRFPY